MFREVLRDLIQGRDLLKREAAHVMENLMDGKLTASQMGAFLAALAAKRETAAELVGLVEVMRARSVRISIQGDVLDTCGTGGSGHATPNTSTLVAFVVAAAGVKVAKHGNRASSGRCGSMDVLEQLGVPILLSPASVTALLETVGIAFMFAPLFHPAMKEIAQVRRELGVRTTFNFLGPLANPATVNLQLLGVSDPTRAPIMIEALKTLGSRRVMVVHGHDGLDEITLTGPTSYWMLADDTITTGRITPEEFGVRPVTSEDLQGGDVEANARLFLAVLKDEAPGAIRDLVAVNAAAALLVANKVQNLRDGFTVTQEIIGNGEALALFERYRDAASALTGKV